MQIEQFGKTSAALAKFLKAMATLDVTLKSGVYDPDDVAETLRDLTTDVLAMEMAVNNLVRR